MSATLSKAQIQARAAALGDWFHNIDLAGVPTAPNHFLNDYPNVKWRRFEHAVPGDLTGKSEAVKPGARGLRVVIDRIEP